MRNKKKLISLSFAIALILAAIPTTKAEAVCSAWVTEGTTVLGCDFSDGCGVLWQDGTMKGMDHLYRVCGSGSESYIERQDVIKSYGCCS